MTLAVKQSIQYCNSTSDGKVSTVCNNMYERWYSITKQITTVQATFNQSNISVQSAHTTAHTRHARGQKACMLKGEVIKEWREKYCTVIREMEKMLVILSEIWSY